MQASAPTPVPKGPKVPYKTIIETRGEGGYILICPSEGYSILQGSAKDIPTITRDEQRVLHELSYSFNRYIAPEKQYSAMPKSAPGAVKRPGDDFNARGDIRPALLKHGWVSLGNDHSVGGQAGVERWRRPGQDKKAGISATLGYRNFYVFSSNAHPFEAGRSYDNFSVLCLLEYGGDFSKCAAGLSNMGYGDEVKYLALKRYLDDRYEFYYNLIDTKRYWRKKNPANPNAPLGSMNKETWEYFLDEDERQILFHASTHLKKNFTMQELENTLAVCSRKLDPFKEYFYGLPPWDGQTDYIAQLGQTVTLNNEEERPVFNMILTRWLVAMVAGLTNHERNEIMIILYGAQGAKKSRWLQRIIPNVDHKKNYIYLGPVNPDDKDQKINLSTKALIIVDEFSDLKRYEVNSLKSFITTDHVNVRKAYGRNEQPYLRRASLAATTNEDEILTDTTGTRRFVPFEVASLDTSFPESLLHNVFIQAHTLYKNGALFYFEKDEIDLVNKRNSPFRHFSDEHALLTETFETNPEVGGRWFSAAEIKDVLSVVHRRTDLSSVRIGKSLHELKAKRKFNPQGGRSYYLKQIAFPTMNPQRSSVYQPQPTTPI